MLSPDEFRRISEQAQQRLKQEQLQAEKAKDQEERRRILKKEEEDNAMADAVIADLPQRVKEAASHGLWSLHVIEIEDRDLLYDPNERNRKWYSAELKKISSRFLGIGFDRGMRDLERRSREYKYEPDCLRPHHRKIYDWCERSGFKTEFRTSIFHRDWPCTSARIQISW